MNTDIKNPGVTPETMRNLLSATMLSEPIESVRVSEWDNPAVFVDVPLDEDTKISIKYSFHTYHETLTTMADKFVEGSADLETALETANKACDLHVASVGAQVGAAYARLNNVDAIGIRIQNDAFNAARFRDLVSVRREFIQRMMQMVAQMKGLGKKETIH